MRGLIPAYIMARIEEMTGLAMARMVDIFAGPSTGAILNAAMNIPSDHDPQAPKYKARHMVSFYQREGHRIFPVDHFRDFRAFVHDFNNRTVKIGQLNALLRHGHYDPAYLGECLKRLYGNSRLSGSLKSLVIPVYNIDGDQIAVAEKPASGLNGQSANFIEGGGHALWLKNIQPFLNKPVCNDVALYDAVLASTAAPTFFPCHHFNADGRHYTGIDGSIFDNPCASYLGALRRHLPQDKNIVMIVLGTGNNHRSFSKDKWNSYGGLGVVDPANDLPLINIFFHASETALAESFNEELGENLHVFNKSLLREVDRSSAPSEEIDDARPENLKRLEHFANALMEEQADKLETLCHILVSNRDQSEESVKPSSFWAKIFAR